MGAVNIKTTEEMELFLLKKQYELRKEGIPVRGNTQVVKHLLEEMMKKENED